MRRFISILSILQLTTCLGFGQKIDTSMMGKIAGRRNLLYRDQNGYLMGCGNSLECSDAQVIFYCVNLDKGKKKIKIQGRIFDPSIMHDTSGLFSYLFLVQIHNDSPVKIRPLSESIQPSAVANDKRSFPHRAGDFVVEFSFAKNDRLFF